MNIKIKKTHIMCRHKPYWQSSALKITHFWKSRINITWLNILLTLKLTVVILGTPCIRQSRSSNTPVTVPDYQLLRRWTVGWNASPQVSGAHDKWKFTLGHSHTPLKGSVNRYRHDSQQGKGNDTNGRNWNWGRNCHHLTSMGPCIVRIVLYIYPTRCNATQFILSGNCSTCFGWYHRPSSGVQTTVSTASGVYHTVTATCRYRGRVGTGLSVLWVAYATHSTLKPVPTLPR